tara:strand:- start:593 stop:976 length:384 start_codon:yes stop_codon:yes gene_type:complete
MKGFIKKHFFWLGLVPLYLVAVIVWMVISNYEGDFVDKESIRNALGNSFLFSTITMSPFICLWLKELVFKKKKTAVKSITILFILFVMILPPFVLNSFDFIILIALLISIFLAEFGAQKMLEERMKH